MADVAAAAGVSAMTVSRALKKDGRVAPVTRAHILAIIARLGYVPDQMAASFSSQKSRFIAALVPSLNNSHFSEPIRVISEMLENEGTQVLLGQTNYQVEREERLLAELLQRRPEAIVLTADAHSTGTRKLLKASGVPVLELWDQTPNPVGLQVGFSNFDAARAMVRFLANAGYRRIVYLGETGDAGMRGARRREGYVAALKELDLGAPRIHLHGAPPIGMTNGREAFRSVRATFPDADAIMCVSDPCAFGVMMEAISMGLSVPGDIGIAGFGNFELGRCSIPSLTTVGVDAAQIGREAGALLLRRHLDQMGSASFIPMPFEVIGRQSTMNLSSKSK